MSPAAQAVLGLLSLIGIVCFWRAALFSRAARELRRERSRRLGALRAQLPAGEGGEESRFRPHALELLTPGELQTVVTEESVSARWIGSRSLGDLSDVQARTMASMARSHARQCAAAGQVLIIAATVVLGSYLPAWVASVARFDGSNEASGSFIGPILAVGGLALAVVVGLRLGDSAERSRRDAAVLVRVHVRGGPVLGETELRRTDPSAAAG